MARKVVEARIAVNRPDCPLLTILINTNLDVKLYSINVSESKVTHILAIREGDVKRLTRMARRLDLKVRYVDLKEGVIWVENSKPCSFCKTLYNLGGVPLSLNFDSGKAPLYRILLPSRKSLTTLMDVLKAPGLEPQLLHAGFRFKVAKLTPLQMRALIIAYENGFFDFPKKVSLKTLSIMLGVKPSTLNEILRRGVRKLVEECIAREELLRF